MGLFSDKVKYFAAYRSIKFVKEKTSHMEGTVDNIYLVDITTIPKFLEILNKHKILKYISDLTKRSEVNVLENKLKDDFGDYELEKNIGLLNINEGNLDNFKNDNFILVDKDFLVNMNIENKNNDGKCKIIVNKDEMKIELSEDKFIIIEETEKKGIYKFGKTVEKSIDVNVGSFVGEKKEQIDEEMDPEVLMYRVNPDDIKKEEEKKEEKKEKEKDKGDNDENNNNLISLNTIVENSQIERGKAQIAEFDEIIKLIFFSIRKSGENKQEIGEEIKKKIKELNFQNELKLENYHDLIKNIKTSIKTLCENFDQNQDLNVTHNSNYTYYHNNDESQNLMQESYNDENGMLLIDDNNESRIHNDQRKIIDPFNFIRVSINSCNNCGNTNKKENVDFYEINSNKEIDNLDDYFKLKFKNKCEICQSDNLEYCYKFETTPEILIIIFGKPQDNKNYIESNIIKENIDLKAHLLNPNNIDNDKYELIKALYVFYNINDKNLYVDIPENEKKEYIPFIVFYRKKD